MSRKNKWLIYLFALLLVQSIVRLLSWSSIELIQYSYIKNYEQPKVIEVVVIFWLCTDMYMYVINIVYKIYDMETEMCVS